MKTSPMIGSIAACLKKQSRPAHGGQGTRMNLVSHHASWSMTLMLVLFSAMIGLTELQAAPYGPNGKAAAYPQPDGSTVQVRVFGDEFYAVAETTEGYTVVYDKKKVLRYAKLAGDGKRFIPTAKRASNRPNHALLKRMGLKKHIRLSRQGRKEAVARGLKRMRADRRGRTLPPRSRGPKAFKEGESPAQASGDTTDLTNEEDPSFAPPSVTRVGEYVGLCLLVDFSDQAGEIAQSEVDDYCNKPNYTGFNNAGSIYDYFYIQSNGRLRYNNIVTAYVRVPNPKTYYDDNSDGTWGNSTAQELVEDALDVLIAQGFDFTRLSTDASGYIYSLNVFYAGTCSSSWGKGLWPHKWAIPTKTVDSTNGIYAYSYQMSDMGSSLQIGTFCHENGHMLMQYPDLYSYNGNAASMGYYTLMASGSHGGGGYHPQNVDPYLKSASGWADIVDLTSSSHQRCTVQVDNNLFYRYKNPSNAQEYFMFEVRDNTGYEGIYGGATSAVNPTSGLVAYHFLESGSNTHGTIFSGDSPNCDYSTPYEALVLEANPPTSTTPWYDDPSPGSADAFKSGGVSAISDSTTPALKFWDSTGRNTASNGDVHSISADSNVMTFVIGSGDPTGSATVALSRANIYNSCNTGENAPSTTFAISNGQGGTLTYNVSDNAAWLTCDVTSGTATTEADLVTVSFQTDTLAAGSYTGTITVDDNGSGSETITVHLSVWAEATLVADPTALAPTGTTGLSGPQVSFELSNSGGGTCDYTISKTQSWLSLSHTTGTLGAETDTVYVDCDATSLAAGTYNDTITISSPTATNSPITVPVTYTVQGTDMIVTAPDGGETWLWDETKTITWASSLGGNVKIELLKAGSLNTEIAASTPNDGSYDWTVPNGQTSGTDYTIRITSVEQPTKTDTSNANFTIENPPIYFTDCEDTDPGFDKTTGHTYGAWEWGTPGSGNRVTSAYSGTSIYDTVLDGSFYDWNPCRLTSVAIDCSNYIDVQLEFYSHIYLHDDFTVYFEVSNDNSTWTPLYSKVGDRTDAWTKYTYDISAVADQQSTVYVRWSAVWTDGNNDSSINYYLGQGVAVDDIKLTGTYVAPSAPEMAVIGNLNEIADGDITPSTTDDTHFDTVAVGESVDHTFTISNTGDGALSLTGTPSLVELIAADEGFSVLTQPSSSTIAAGGSNTFVIRFAPSVTGVQEATVSIDNDDSDENPYDFKIIANDATYYTLTVTNGSGDGSYVSGTDVSIVAEAAPANYHFTNWTTADGGSFANANASSTTYSMPSNNATVTANYAGDEYTVTFNANGGSTPSPTSKTVTYDSTYGTLATTSRTGYTFNGWFTAASGGTQVTSSTAVTETADHTLYAQWTLNTVNLVTDVASVGVPEGSTNTFQVKLSAQPTTGVSVSVARSAGDTDISVTGGASLSFDTVNWDTYQTVTLTAAEDGDTTNGSATITCTASGDSTDTANVTANEVDDDFTLTVNDDGNGTTTPSGAVVIDSTNQLPYAVSATANTGKVFVSWTDASSVLTDATAASTTVKSGTTADCTITANFAAEGLLVYEGFQYGTAGAGRASSDLFHNQPDGSGGDIDATGLGGTWQDQAGPGATTDLFLYSGSLAFGDLATTGNSVRTDTNLNNDLFTRSVTANLAAGTELWFSILANKLQNNFNAAEGGLVIGNQAVNNSRVFEDTGSTGLAGFGVAPTTAGNDWTAYAWYGSTQTAGDASLTVATDGTQVVLLVGKIVYDAGAGGTDQFTLYEYQLNAGSVSGGTLSQICSTIEVNVDQTTLNTLSLTRQVNTAYDEIRIGETFAAVVPVPNDLMLEDAEDGDTADWDVYDNSPTGTVSNVTDPDDSGNKAIQLTCDSHATGFRFTLPTPDETYHKLSWRQKMSEEYYIYVNVATDDLQGQYYLRYEGNNTPKYDDSGFTGYYFYGLGTGTKKGSWCTIRRDLQADLDAKTGGGVNITSVTEFLVRGPGYIDDLQLLESFSNAAPTLSGTTNAAGTGVDEKTVSTTGDDSDGDCVSYAWSVTSGTGEVLFTSEDAAGTGVNFGETGDYTLQVAAYDGHAWAGTPGSVSFTVSELIHEDGTDTGSWMIYDNDPVGSILTVIDGDAAIDLGGSIGTGYLKTFSPKVSNDFTMSWDQKFSDYHVIYVACSTTNGPRYLSYRPDDTSPTLSGNYVYIGMGEPAMSGSWVSIRRNLQSDLTAADGTATIEKINGIWVRGTGRLDDIKTGVDATNTLPTIDPITVNAGTGTQDKSLDATCSDANGDALSYSWSMVSGPTAEAVVSFTTPKAEDTGVDFSETGTYTLKLTVDDGNGTSEQTVDVIVDTLVLEDGADVASWKIYDNDPAGNIATADESGNAVIELSGGTVGTGYMKVLQAKLTSDVVISWKQKSTETSYIYIACTTDNGPRYFRYGPEETNGLKNGSYIHFGLGATSKDGTWSAVSRNLQTDLDAAETGVTVNSIDQIWVRGNVRLDDIQVSSP